METIGYKLPIESFNARNYTAAQVAETFIINEDYKQLWSNQHTVVQGPRGSGKTTLLKMLTVPAIYSWDHDFARQIRQSRPFTAVYVPTDMHWHHQLSYSDSVFKDNPNLSDTISNAAVTTSILICLARTFLDRLENELIVDKLKEIALSKALLTEWSISTDCLPTLRDIIANLRLRIAEIRSFTNKAIYYIQANQNPPPPSDWFFSDYLALISVSCRTFDACLEQNQDAKWALCFDELELAPLWLQKKLLSQQRSTDEKLLFKLSTSPVPAVLSSTAAEAGHDFQLLAIWNHAGRTSNDFFDALASAILKRRHGQLATPQAVFGVTDLANDEDSSPEYSEDSATWQVIRDVAEWDDGLKQLLDNRGIDPTNPTTNDQSLRDTVLRKIKPLVIFRNAFQKATGSGKVQGRSRKRIEIYCGWEAIRKISDGNPRRLIGIIQELSTQVKRPKNGEIVPIDRNIQAKFLTQASLQFANYLKAIPESQIYANGRYIELSRILKSIGRFFHDKLVKGPFTMDPLGSVTVDQTIEPNLEKILRTAAYHGAIIIVDQPTSSFDSSIKGKRFRLSYILAPWFKLPLRLYKSASLLGVLRESPFARVRNASSSFEQIVSNSRDDELPLSL